MYIREYEGLGQPAEVVRDFEEQKRHFEMAKAEHKKRFGVAQKISVHVAMPQRNTIGTELQAAV